MLRGIIISLALCGAGSVQANESAQAVLASTSGATASQPAVAPVPRDDYIPRARWDFRPEGRLWTRTTLEALKGHGRPLLDMVPRDMADWCPAYADNDDTKRAAFWNGFLSALAKHESTWKPRAVGGGGKWYGLTQILPATARGYKCRVGTGDALKNGSANLSCAVRIMAFTVKRDNAVARKANGRLGGVAADWGPMINAKKRKEMAGWIRQQSYCKPLQATKPIPRPAGLTGPQEIVGLSADQSEPATVLVD